MEHQELKQEKEEVELKQDEVLCKGGGEEDEDSGVDDDVEKPDPPILRCCRRQVDKQEEEGYVSDVDDAPPLDGQS